MKGKRSRILKSSSWTKWNENKAGKSEDGIRLADFQ